MDDDKTLMSYFQAGDDESFEKLIIKHRRNAVSFARKYINDFYLAEDIVQESFADLYVYKQRYDRKYSFKTYLYTIIRNKSIDYIRKNQTVSLKHFEQIDKRSPETYYLEQERQGIILSHLNSLKEEYRTVLYLSQWEELKYREIAKIMGKNVNQIKVLAYRARKSLKKLIEKEAIK